MIVSPSASPTCVAINFPSSSDRKQFPVCELCSVGLLGHSSYRVGFRFLLHHTTVRLALHASLNWFINEDESWMRLKISDSRRLMMSQIEENERWEGVKNKTRSSLRFRIVNPSASCCRWHNYKFAIDARWIWWVNWWDFWSSRPPLHGARAMFQLEFIASQHEAKRFSASIWTKQFKRNKSSWMLLLRKVIGEGASWWWLNEKWSSEIHIFLILRMIRSSSVNHVG